MAALLALATVLLTACGGATASSGKSTDLLTDQGSNRTSQLVAAAKAEGHLTWYTSLEGPSVAALAEAFEKKYPYIKVNYTAVAENVIVSRVTQESRAGKQTADVVEIPGTDAVILQSEGLLQQYWTPGLGSLPSVFKNAGTNGDVWAATDRISPIGFGYNTTLIPASAVPTTFNGLLNPALKGKMAIGESSGVLWVGEVLHELGNGPGQTFLKKFASTQDVKPESITAAAVEGLVAQGQIAASPAIYRDHVLLYQSKGDPTQWDPLEDVTLNDGRVAITKHAAHPAAAELFAQFLLSSAGQSALKSNNYLSPLSKITFKYWLPEQTYTTGASYAAAFDEWTKIFDSDFGA